MAKFIVNRTDGYTVMSNNHLRNEALSLKAKGLLCVMLSLPPNWNYTLKGLACICIENVETIRKIILELEKNGYIKRYRERNEAGQLGGIVYEIYETPQEDDECPDDYTENYPDGDKTPENTVKKKEEAERTDSEKSLKNKGFSPKLKNSVLVKNREKFTESSPELKKPVQVKPAQVKPVQVNSAQLNKDILNKDINNKKILNNINNSNNINISNDVDKSNLIVSNLKNKIHKEEDEIRCDKKETLPKRASPDLKEIREKLKETTCYEAVLNDFPADRYMINEIIEIMTETILNCEKEDEILVASSTYPSDMVKQRLYSLNENHLRYVTECMRNNRSDIRNIKKYLLAALFNAPATMHHYMAAEVNRDMLSAYKQDD